MAATDGLDERFITTKTLEEYFVDKDTGAPLAGGSVQFYKDSDRMTAKLVYQLSGDPSIGVPYTYTALADPITLSGVGTIVNAGNNVALYYFPYQGTPSDSDGTLELYYVVVRDSFGVVQFTREAWPNSVGSQNPTAETGLQDNQVSNGQFVDFSSYTEESVTIHYTGSSTQTINIAPDWQLQFTHTGDGDLLIAREAIAGSSAYPTNPPYYLAITPGLNIFGSMILKQVLPHNPGIWSQTTDGMTAYVIGGILLANGSSAAMAYVPSAGTSQTILATTTNSSGGPKYYTATKALPVSDNGNSSTAGNVTLQITISGAAVTRLSSVQLMGSLTGDANVPYIQETVNRQQDHMFHYYKEPLIAKAIPSYLTGWDFPLNPAQFGGTAQNESLIANQSKYVWDQTIMYQSVAASFRVSGTALGAIQLDNRTAGTAQFALVQYLDQTQARKVLANLLSVQVAGNTSMTNGLGLTVSLWYTTGSPLPDLKTPNFKSIVATLDANGKPATFNGTWVEVPTVDGINKYGVLPNGSNNQGDPLNFEYWDTTQVATACTTATFFAIVVGSAPADASALTSFRSISLVPGTLATAPAPQTLDEVARECKFYYQKTYQAGTVPGTAATYLGMRGAYQAPAGSSNMWPTVFEINFSPEMRGAPSLTLYSSVLGTVANVTYKQGTTVVGDVALSGNWTTSSPNGTLTEKNAVYASTGGSAIAGITNLDINLINYHYVADARLGVL